MGNRFIDITGQRFGKLIALRLEYRKNVNPVYWYCCKCDCGNFCVVRGTSLRSGATQSCGCLRLERQKAKVTKHGKSKDPLHYNWESIISRCFNINNKSYKNYGGRGITVCERWQGEEGFENFLADMGERPEGKTLERIDNDGPYSPENCRWATRTEQGRNKRNNHLITYNGRTLCITAWAEEKNVPATLLYGRFLRGWDIERALNAPYVYNRNKEGPQICNQLQNK